MIQVQQGFAIYETSWGIEVLPVGQRRPGGVLICTCQHPQAAERIAVMAAQKRMKLREDEGQGDQGWWRCGLMGIFLP